MTVSRAGVSGARSWIVAAALVGWLVLASAQIARAQGATGSGPPAPESAAPAEPVASAETRSRVAEIDTEIARLGKLEEEWASRSARFALARQEAPASLAALEAEAAKLKRRDAPGLGADRAVAELETELLGSEQDLALARKAAAGLEAEAAGRAERRKQIPELLAAAKERLLALESEATASAGEPALVAARSRLARARSQAIESEIAAYEEELRSYDARGQLLVVRREVAALRVGVLEARVEALQQAISARRQGEAEVAAQEAERSVEFTEPMPPAVLDVVRELAAENRELALRRTGPDGLLQQIEDASRKLARAERQVAQVTADLELLRRNVEAPGLSGSVGFLLRKTRANAPDAGMYRRFIRMRRNQISGVQLQQIELSERRQALADVDEIVAKRMADFESLIPPEERAAVEARLRDLLDTQRRYLDTLIADTETYFQKLVDFDARQRELVQRTQALVRFVDERVLWVRSGEAFPDTFAADAMEALAWLTEKRFWSQILRALVTSIRRSPLLFAGGALLLLALPWAGPRIRARVAKLGELARDPSCIRMEPSVAALAWSLLLALWGPGLLAFLGWRLGLSLDATQFVRCFASGLLAAAFVWATLLVPRQLLRPAGIAEAHLGWPAAATRDLRLELRWASGLVIPAVFVIAVFEVRAEEAWSESVGRLAFLLTMGAALVFTHRVLRKDGGAVRRILTHRVEASVPPGTWRILFAAALALPAGLAVGAARGYYWTSLQLATSIHATLIFLFLLAFAHQLGARWLLLAGRRLALRRWHEATVDRGEAASPVPDLPPTAREEPEVDLATVDEQTGRLLKGGTLLAAAIGVSLILGDLLPAASALRSVELWQTSTTATVEMVDAAGERISSVEERLVPVTLSDLLLALLVVAATIALARNLPGLMEISMFRHLRSSAGERYAYATIGKYTVTLVGVAAALQLVGVGWSNIQWLLAAVGIGLGFGLQEIFANFISGLIILFERPIRVGDTLTVGDISGTVSKIRIRATWITGFDRKELVVPNKEFITSRLVNWSLSDAVLRVEIPVGIAYGSDTERAQRVLEDVARRNPHVLEEPPPHAVFRGFGDSCLEFELRAFSPDVSHYLKIVHELHMEIDRAFRAEGIEIAFPQRDLHVRSLPVHLRDAVGAPQD
jgi:potassium efflux system protein